MGAGTHPEANGVTRGPGRDLDVRVHAVISAAGELDLATAPLVTETVRQVAAPGVTITVELAEVSFCDLSGAQALLQAADLAAAAGASFAIAHPPRSLRNVLRAVELPSLPVIADTGCSIDPPNMTNRTVAEAPVEEENCVATCSHRTE